jgi:hypothetical protein
MIITLKPLLCHRKIGVLMFWYVSFNILFFLINVKMINIKTLKGLNENELFQIEDSCSICGEYSKEHLKVVYDKLNDGTITGCLLYQNRFTDISNLFFLFIKPSFRNQGIATKIINVYKKIANPFIIICIEEKSKAISFFSKHQFKIMNKSDLLKYEMNIVCDEDDIIMAYKK